MKNYQKARRFAVQILYQMSPLAPGIVYDFDRVFADFWGNAGEVVKPDVKEITEARVRGVMADRPAIDQLIEKHAQNWRLDRLSPVDLAILRLGTFELLSAQAVPTAACIDEAIELAKRFSNVDSPGFVNGILDAVAKEVRV